MADEQEAPKNPNDRMGVFKNSLPSHAPVSTCWAEEVSDFQHPPTITTINAINTIWLCEEHLDHHDPCVPASKGDPKLRSESFFKGIRLQEEPREEAPPKEEEEMPLKGEMLPEEVRSSTFWKCFKKEFHGKRKIQKKREKRKKRRRLNGLSRTCLRRRRTNHL